MGIYRGPNIVKDGLVLLLDASSKRSYPGTGSTWFDLSGNGAHGILVDAPTFVSNGSASYFQFNGTSNVINSVDISQNYVDLFIGMEYENGGVSDLQMVFAKYDGVSYHDKSFRIGSGQFRISTTIDGNDWQFNEQTESFVDGIFPSSDILLDNNLHIIRTFKSSGSFGATFRYCISSEFLNRRFKGKISYIIAYNRKLSNEEVKQNFNAHKTRFGL